MAALHNFLARSEHWVARLARQARSTFGRFTLPAPFVVVKPCLAIFLVVRVFYWTLKRILVCEPLFKAYCKQYGRHVRTGTFVHYVIGSGDIIVGDDVLVDGKCSFSFGARFSNRPTIFIGDHTGIGHNCSFTVGQRITIGKSCRIASDVWIFDSPGHPADPEARMAGSPPIDKDVRPVTVGDNVWIGRRAIIFPGVTIGQDSIVSAGSVVMQDVPPCTVVAGNPARRIASLERVVPPPQSDATPARGELQTVALSTERRS